jgi:hypothetical protein
MCNWRNQRSADVHLFLYTPNDGSSRLLQNVGARVPDFSLFYYLFIYLFIFKYNQQDATLHSDVYSNTRLTMHGPMNVNFLSSLNF